MEHVQTLLDWITSLRLIEVVLNKARTKKIIVFGGILRTIMETREMSLDESKDYIIKYLENGGDIDIVANRSDLHPTFKDLMYTMQKRNPQFKCEQVEYTRKLNDTIKKINDDEKICITDIVHNYDDYFGRNARRRNMAHFHSKIKGHIFYNHKSILASIDITEYTGMDDKMKDLTYDFSTNMARALFERGAWNIDSRYEDLDIYQIYDDVIVRKYTVIGGRQHIGTHRYFKMVQRGYWPKEEKDIDIFISHVFDVLSSCLVNDKESTGRVIKFMFEHEALLKKHLNTGKYRCEKNHILRAIIIADLHDANYVSKYFDLFDKKPTIGQYEISCLLEYATVSLMEYIETRADMVFSDMESLSNNLLYTPIQSVEMLKYVMQKCKIDKPQVAILARKTHALFMVGINPTNQDEPNLNLIDASACMKNAMGVGNIETVEFLHTKFPTILTSVMRDPLYMDEEHFNPKVADMIMKASSNKTETAFKLILIYPLVLELVDVLYANIQFDAFVVGTYIARSMAAMKKEDYSKVINIICKMADLIDKPATFGLFRFLETSEHEKAKDLYYSIPHALRTKHGVY